MARINLNAAVRAAEQGEYIADISQALDQAQARGEIDAEGREQIMQQLGAAYDSDDTRESNAGLLGRLLGIRGR